MAPVLGARAGTVRQGPPLRGAAGGVSEARGRTAFTLGELLVAMAFATLAILLVVELAIACMRANQKGGDLMLANGLASQAVEQMVYSLPPISDSFWSTPQAFLYNSSSISLNGVPFQQDVYLTQLDTIQQGLKMVLVNVSWGSGSGGRTGYGAQVVQATRMIYAH